MSEFDVLYSCNNCGKRANGVKPTSTVEGYTAEAETKCQECGHEDYWAYGHFESGTEIVGKSEKYYG